MQNSVRLKQIFIGLSFVLSMIYAGRQVHRSIQIGNSLSGDTDVYTEQAALRSAIGYYEQGLTSNSGLADYCYGEIAYTGMNTLGDRPWPKGPCVYTHYPQGAEFLTGLMHYIFGPQKIVLYRMFPIAFWFAANLFLIWVLSSLFSPLRAFLFHTSLLIIPMYTNMMHGVYFQTYVFSLLIIQLALGLKLLGGGKTINWKYLFIFFLLGHLQGWFSLDMCFLATFFAIPIGFLKCSENSKDRWKMIFGIVLVSGLGYTFAQILHFLEVINYRGGLEAAIADFTQSAKERALIDESTRWFNNYKYLFVYSKLKRFFNFSLGHLSLVLLFLTGLLAMKGDLKRSTRVFLGSFCAFVISSLWIWAMKQHAYHHPHFITRHFFLFYFMGASYLICDVSWFEIRDWLFKRFKKNQLPQGT